MELEDSLIFVHDASKHVIETDDPIKTVVYFSQESNVTDDQKSELCNNLVALCASVKDLRGKSPHCLILESYNFSLFCDDDITVCYGFRKKFKTKSQSVEASLRLLVLMMKMRYSCLRKMVEVWDNTGCHDNLKDILKRAEQQSRLLQPFDVQMHCHLFIEHIAKQCCPLAVCLMGYSNQIIYSPFSNKTTSAITSLVHFVDYKSYKMKRNLSVFTSFPLYLPEDVNLWLDKNVTGKSLEDCIVFPDNERSITYECQVVLTVLSNSSCTLYILSRYYHSMTDIDFSVWEESLNNLGTLVTKNL